jgi:cobalt-zinc-cadmium efflux system protein
LIGVYIIKETWSVLKETIDILMQGTPRNIDINRIKQAIEKLEQVENIHHVHVWSLSDRQVHFECHLDLRQDLQVSQTEGIQKRIEQLLHDKFDIHHVTIQFEYNVCDEKTVIN